MIWILILATNPIPVSAHLTKEACFEASDRFNKQFVDLRAYCHGVLIEQTPPEGR